MTFPADAPAPARARVIRGGGHAETTFLGPDAPPGAAAVRACADFLDAQPGGLLAICGSVPGWGRRRPFRPRLPACPGALRLPGAGQLVADTYGAPLAWLAAHPLALVKINGRNLRRPFSRR